MENKNCIGNRIKYLRERECLTQKQLATRLGLKGETAIANYESGYSIPKDDIKFRLCDIFNCSLDYLMCKSNMLNSKNLSLDDIDIAFATGIRGLNKENQEIAKNIIEGLLAKQKNEEKNIKEK